MNHELAAALAAAQTHFAAGRLDRAAPLLNDILAAEPDHGEALEGLAYIAAKQGDHARAADYAIRAAANLDMSAEQLNIAAHICQLAQRHVDAAALFERSVERHPHHIESLHGLAMALIRIGGRPRALECLERLCRLQPRSAEAHYNCGTVLGELGRHEDEVAMYGRAIALKPNFVSAYVNLGVALRYLQRFDEALQQFRKALSIDPNDAGARTNRAQTNLLLGEFEHGWREYEWRWRDGVSQRGFADSTLWSGTQPVNGKTVLVHYEQGFGDTLQFVRFVDRLGAAGARVVLRVQDALLPLLRGYRGVDGAAGAGLKLDVIGESAPVPPFDYHIPTMSLPFALKLREADLVVSGAYVQADPALAAQWDDLFAQPATRPRIGVVWSGSRIHVNDHNRSMPLEQLMPLFGADADFFSLQKDVRDGDRACVAQLVQQAQQTQAESTAGPRGLRDVSARLGSFADTAALIARLDLVIAVDTAVAHLAGALGKPVWIALPFVPDWRWQLNRTDSRWYAGARLFRQSAPGDWRGVVSALRGEVDALGRADGA